MDKNVKLGLEHLDKILNNWLYRYLSPYGKITINKSLAIPKITHLAIVLPDFNEVVARNLERRLFNFLWDGKPDKISRVTAKLPISKGGLNMVCFRTFFKSLQIAWIQRIQNSNSFWKEILDLNLQQIGFSCNNIIFYTQTHQSTHTQHFLEAHISTYI